MYYLKPGSLSTDMPVFQRLDETGLLFPEHTTGRWFAEKGIPETALIEWSKQLIQPDQIFVDIGAHVGTYSLELARKCKTVHAFECSPRTYNFLCGNIALKGLENIRTYNTALGERTGTTPYYVRSGDGGGNGCLLFENRKSSPCLEVPIHRLDDYNLDNIGFIKIDVEGYEKQVLEGAQETLKRNKYPKFLFESWEPWREREGVPAKTLRDELFAYIDSIGYRVIPLLGNTEMFLAEPIGKMATSCG